MATAKPDVTPIWASDVGALIATPSDTKIADGWEVEKPPVEYMNWLQNQFSKFINHVNERGIPQHDLTTEYLEGSIVFGSDGVIYQSQQATNTNHEPTTDDGTWWKKFGGGPLIEPPAYSTVFDYSADNSWWLKDGGSNEDQPFARTRGLPISDTDFISMRLSNVESARARKSDHLASWQLTWASTVLGGGFIREVLAYYYDSVDGLIYAVMWDTVSATNVYFTSVNPTTGAFSVLATTTITSTFSTNNFGRMFLDRPGGEGVGNFIFTYAPNVSYYDTEFIEFSTVAAVSSGQLQTEDAYSPNNIVYYTADKKTLLLGISNTVEASEGLTNYIKIWVRRGGNDRVIRIPVEYSDAGGIIDMIAKGSGTTSSFDLWAGDVAVTFTTTATTPFTTNQVIGSIVNYFDRVSIDKWLNDWCDHERMNPGVAFNLV